MLPAGWKGGLGRLGQGAEVNGLRGLGEGGREQVLSWQLQMCLRLGQD